MEIETFKKILPLAWCAETAYGKWNSEVPSFNQCAVTALVFQEYFGGKILRRKMTDGRNHFLNKLPDDTEVDLTEDQFLFINAKPIRSETTVCTRKSLLRHMSVVRRYNLLKQNIEKLIQE